LLNWIDDRNEVQGRAHVQDYFATLQGAPGWQERLERARVALVCIEPKVPLASRLAENAAWREVFRDDWAVIFAKNSAGHRRASVAGGFRVP
jgi:hypothetical protein